MVNHRLPKGTRLIRGIEALGRVLGYHVRKEFPVSEGGAGLPEAVDVAWFEDPNRPYPLMIFEVESRASNTIASNPLKVFGQDNRRFEKPLFFFQLLAAGGQSTPRVAQLERQYGTYNYRLYRLAQDEGTVFVKDVVTQHRRISRQLDYVKLYEVLRSPEWSGLADALAVVDHAYELGLRREQLLPSVIRLARQYGEVAARLPALVEGERVSGWVGTDELATWWGKTWGPMVLSAWMCGRSGTPAEAAAWDDHLLCWQNHASFMPMFSSELALSHEYAEFMLALGGPFAVLVVGLGRARGGTGQRLCEVLVRTLKKLPPDWHGLQLAAWTLHLSARLGLVHEYETASRYVGAVGGLAAEDMMVPPSCVDLGDSVREGQFRSSDRVSCGHIEEFASSAGQTHALQPLDRTRLMLAVLDEDWFHLNWNRDVLAALWQDSSAAG